MENVITEHPHLWHTRNKDNDSTAKNCFIGLLETHMPYRPIIHSMDVETLNLRKKYCGSKLQQKILPLTFIKNGKTSSQSLPYQNIKTAKGQVLVYHGSLLFYIISLLLHRFPHTYTTKLALTPEQTKSEAWPTEHSTTLFHTFKTLPYHGPRPHFLNERWKPSPSPKPSL